MSTSALVAKSDLLKQLPSCSYSVPAPSTDLDVFSWSRIFENVAASVPLKQALEFKTLHSEAYYAVNRAFRRVKKLKIEILSTDETLYIIQDSCTKNPNVAVEMVRFVLSKARKVSELELYFEDLDLKVLNRILDEVVESENVELESLRVKRRNAGQSVTKIGDVIRANSTTLREITRVGISEASHGFDDRIRLERFGCMSFDIGIQAAPHQVPIHMIRITESGAKFSNFSYTSFSGFDPSEPIVQNMLDSAEVTTLKLTMMNAPVIASRPGYMVGKVRRVKRVELVEIVAEPQRINKLVACRHVFEKVFPNCHDLLFLQQWD
ncbi:Protein CBG05629 [Caenorhabditis briggsae]|uniref:Uncharacterized protein n=2 Tax=Caenorhabditis briggsae TaxID=6238 RepID=A0AAE9D3T8_CAEBR|nr:Protein CBG05629 [Caenorhabditis briggsae]ULT92771.1 hypothetical protein L3Y34_010100 [Caenorhabditis briggsae]CAP26069.1 Protein CBG05629 [Caenorhabditis briggsae]